jgi:hypothetical protein
MALQKMPIGQLWGGGRLVDLLRSSLAATQLGLAPINLIVWAKTNAGMGSLYRSQHELLPLFKKGDGDHLNNINLGRKGRWRSNIWVYPGARSGQMRATASKTTRP